MQEYYSRFQPAGQRSTRVTTGQSRGTPKKALDLQSSGKKCLEAASEPRPPAEGFAGPFLTPYSPWSEARKGTTKATWGVPIGASAGAGMDPKGSAPVRCLGDVREQYSLVTCQACPRQLDYITLRGPRHGSLVSR